MAAKKGGFLPLAAKKNVTKTPGMLESLFHIIKGGYCYSSKTVICHHQWHALKFPVRTPSPMFNFIVSNRNKGDEDEGEGEREKKYDVSGAMPQRSREEVLLTTDSSPIIFNIHSCIPISFIKSIIFVP